MERVNTPIFLLTSKHAPENCPSFNEQTRKVFLDYVNKANAIAKKYGVKIIGEWTVPYEHLFVGIYEASSFEVIMKALMEPEAAARGASETLELKLMMSIEDAVKTLPKSK